MLNDDNYTTRNYPPQSQGPQPPFSPIFPPPGHQHTELDELPAWYQEKNTREDYIADEVCELRSFLGHIWPLVESELPAMSDEVPDKPRSRDNMKSPVSDDAYELPLVEEAGVGGKKCEKEITATLAEMDTSDARVANAVEVHTAVVQKVRLVAEAHLQSILEQRWLREFVAYRLALEPLLTQLRLFIAGEAPALGKRSPQHEEAIWRWCGPAKWAVSPGELRASGDADFVPLNDC
ncbi:hypothetical protein CspeluHIS016_0111520 [Cutaneotrichosporon spelunceum]|uniref:Uncharacterized protein n=1 Tax=Cutaneotrichosporon spelunceum TaxID=1672016 RepID=A0AAD3TPC0_9TREE|nr:hypothetical protein CspeluHIS016_0111520 [Cutaneotrichosporon spelunceum]